MIGNKLKLNSITSKTPYQFDINLLSDSQIINAFALHGGQIFITYALFSRLKIKINWLEF